MSSETAPSGSLGFSVALSNDTLVAASIFDDVVTGPGWAYLYKDGDLDGFWGVEVPPVPDAGPGTGNGGNAGGCGCTVARAHRRSIPATGFAIASLTFLVLLRRRT